MLILKITVILFKIGEYTINIIFDLSTFVEFLNITKNKNKNSRKIYFSLVMSSMLM
jgi:hypothetical protein